MKLIGIDSLGFDLRLCSGMEIETLRFAFLTRVSLKTLFSDHYGNIKIILTRLGMCVDITISLRLMCPVKYVFAGNISAQC